ncbi:MAG: CidA/LrgA family protein [Magnetospiraceae bacterium]
MLAYLTLIFCCQFIGELIVTVAALPIPGPVIGLVLLFLGLLVRGSVPKDLDQLADGLLSHLSLLFVPAGVGVMLHVRLIGDELLPISAALIGSTLFAIGVSAWVMAKLSKAKSTPDEAEG